MNYLNSIDSTQYNSVTSIDSAYDAIDNSPPTISQSKFIPLIANLKGSSYSALNSYVKVDKNLTSLSQKIELPTNTNDTITFSEEDFITEALIVNPNYPTKVVNKTTKSTTISGSLGEGLLPVSLSGSISTTTSYSFSDYMDLNGDKYPDIVGFEKVQYTTSQGGLSSSPTTHLTNHNGTHISAHKSVSIAESASVSGSLPRAEKMTANNPKTAKTSVAQASSISASGGASDDITDFTWLDINGDGLPDKVTKEGMVCLNYGYSFSEPQPWFTGNINKSESSNEGASVGFTFYNDSYSGGIGVDVSNSTLSYSLTDINGDGLPDYVYKHNNSLRVKFNTGSGFDNNWYEISSEEINKSSSKSRPLNLSASAIIPIWGFKIIMNGGGSVSKSTSIDNLQIADFDGDGIPDIVSSSSIGSVAYKKSKIGKTNLLKKVTNFAHGSFEVDYELSKPTFNSSQRQYVMSELVVFDGFVGDGSDYMRTQFEYDSAYYDRYERESFGFKKVVSKQLQEDDNSVYRQTTELYHIDKLLFKGLKYYDETCKGNGHKLVANYYDYRLYDIPTGVLIDDSNHCVNMVAYPGLNEKHTYYYKGDGSNYEKHHKISYTYGPYGNIKSYCNHGGVENGESEKFCAHFRYHEDLQDKNILSSPQSIIVVNADSVLLQKRETEINYYNGNIEKIKIYSTEHDYSDYLFHHDQNGNIDKIAHPIGADGNRYNLYYEYDPVLQQFPVKVRDILGFESSASYDYKFGAVTQTIDVGGNRMKYGYDDRGRLIELIGPYEMENHDYYTIRHEYFNSRLGDIHINRATTRHFNPDFPEEDMLTVSFSDGLGRLVQTKKTSEIYNPQLGYAELMMTVSGKIIYDEFGRAVEAVLPHSLQHCGYKCCR
ncbi:MAG: toxin TcdB middle/N-terminal domain-containing protein [Bacteroidales bacterium]